MTFIAKESTTDGRLTGGRFYQGQLIYVSTVEPGLRIVVYDNKKEWTSFKPVLFSSDTMREKVLNDLTRRS